MGLYDTFIDGKKRVLLGNFSPFMTIYQKGEDLSGIMEEYLCPITAHYFCGCDPDLESPDVVHIENGVFMGIDNLVKFPLFDCTGKYYDVHTFELLKEKRKCKI